MCTLDSNFSAQHVPMYVPEWQKAINSPPPPGRYPCGLSFFLLLITVSNYAYTQLFYWNIFHQYCLDIQLFTVCSVVINKFSDCFVDKIYSALTIHLDKDMFKAKISATRLSNYLAWHAIIHLFIVIGLLRTIFNRSLLTLLVTLTKNNS